MWLKTIGLLLLLSVMIFLVRPRLLKRAGSHRKWFNEPVLELVAFLLVTIMINVPLFGWDLYTLIWILIVNIPVDFILILRNRYKSKRSSRFNTK